MEDMSTRLKELIALTLEYDVELKHDDGVGCVAYFPNDPDLSVANRVMDLIGPGTRVVVGLKPSTQEKIGKLLSEVDEDGQEVDMDGRKALVKGWMARYSEHRVIVEVKDGVDVSPVWDRLCEALRRDGYARWWRVGDHVYDPDVAEALAANPRREAPIDMVDVKIEIDEIERLMNATGTTG